MKRMISILLTAILFLSTLVMPTNAQQGGPVGTKPWMNTKLPAEERTKLLLNAMTLEQKIQQIAISRFNENDKGETVVIKRGGTNKYQSGVFPPQGTLPGCEWQDTGRQIR
ncbi:hypothetical protein V7111_02755, partial [Neobacillus niacini]|uniref:hypothetical protein n=1 Tax=Neobacillus niacini TaxID=86668 RepID=UPI002FFF6FF1